VENRISGGEDFFEISYFEAVKEAREEPLRQE
jgi:hypothetical protein